MRVGRPVRALEVVREERRVAERRAHQEKARLREREERDLPRDAAVAVGVVVELVHDDLLHVGAPAPARSAMFARISAVQQTIGASRFTVASPVIIPTSSGPNARHRSKNFSLTSALIGAV